MKVKNLNVIRSIVFIIFFIILLAYVFPLYWMFSSSLKPTREITHIPPTWWPREFTLEGFIKVWQPEFLRYFLNSVIYAGGSVSIALFTGSLIAFVVVIYPSKLGTLLLWASIAVLMIPFTILIIPLYLMEIRFGMLNSYFGMIAPRVIYPFGIFFLQLTVKNVPRDLIDAGRIDGCTPIRLYWQIVLPLLKTSMATLATLSFVWRWNELLWPLIVASSEKLFPITVALAALVDPYFTDFDQYLAACVIVITPIIIMTLMLQKFFVRGISITGMK